jgi:hypothetical protein
MGQLPDIPGILLHFLFRRLPQIQDIPGFVYYHPEHLINPGAIRHTSIYSDQHHSSEFKEPR